jgi:hypothetical protein
MKVKLNLNEIDLNDPKQIALFQLLCSLSTTRTCLALYMGETGERTNLPPQDDIIMLAMALAGIGETVHMFDELISKGVIRKPINCDSVLAEAWKLIESQAIKELKKTNLKYIRDKSAFHFDPKPILEFFTESRKETNEIELWETCEQDKLGFSPLASLIISNTIINVTKPNKERAELSIKVYGALSTIVLDEMNELYNLNAIQ